MKMRRHKSLHSVTQPAVVAFVLGMITAEELFTLPFTEYPYVVKGDVVYASNEASSDCTIPITPYAELPKSDKPIEVIMALVAKPVQEFEHIAELIRASTSMSPTPLEPPIDAHGNTVYMQTTTPLLTNVPTCQDTSLDTQYQTLKEQILKDHDEEWVKEIIVVDNVLLSSVSSCAKRGRIKSFLDLYHAVKA